MFHSNLTFVRKFVEESYLLSFLEEEVKNWSSEIEVRYSSRAGDVDYISAFWFRCGVNRKLIRTLSQKEKILYYKLLRLVAIYTNDGALKFLFSDYTSTLNERNFAANSPEYFYLESLNDNQFVYEMDCRLTPGTFERRYLYRQLQTRRRIGKDVLSLREMLSRVFFSTPQWCQKPKHKRLQRHKGYRDHGSLGSESNRLAKEIRTDISILEQENRRKKERNDLLDFLSGFGGWE